MSKKEKENIIDGAIDIEKFCLYCGDKLRLKQKYCNKCGNKI